MSTKAECRPTSRMRLVIKVISIPHDFLRGPHIEYESTSPAISVAVKHVSQHESTEYWSYTRHYQESATPMVQCIHATMPTFVGWRIVSDSNHSPLKATIAPYLQTSQILIGRVTCCLRPGLIREEGGEIPGVS